VLVVVIVFVIVEGVVIVEVVVPVPVVVEVVVPVPVVVEGIAINLALVLLLVFDLTISTGLVVKGLGLVTVS